MEKLEHKLKVYGSIADMVSNLDNPSPMVRLSEKFNPNENFQIYLKLERYNPLGSIKDRVALSMLEGIEVKDGQSLAEPSSGNTGIALAALANAKGIPIEIAVPEMTSEENKWLLKLLGAELWEVPDHICPLHPSEGARGFVRDLVNNPGYNGSYVSPNQYENGLNVLAHYKTTGPEIWKQTKGKINYFFAGFGTCGTISGIGKYLKEQNPDVKIIGIEPAERDHSLPGLKKISDLSPDLVPKILDKSVIYDVVKVGDRDAYQTGIDVARKCGVLVGPTTGAILYAALKYAQYNDGLAVAISPDDAFKYVSFYKKYLEEEG